MSGQSSFLICQQRRQYDSTEERYTLIRSMDLLLILQYAVQKFCNEVQVSQTQI